MFRKLVCSVFVMTVSLGFVAAEEFGALITKVDGTKVTYYKVAKKGKKDGDAITMELAKDAKVAAGKFDKTDKKWTAGDAIEDGIKAKIFTDIDAEKGVPVRITTDDDKKGITQILVTKKGK